MLTVSALDIIEQVFKKITKENGPALELELEPIEPLKLEPIELKLEPVELPKLDPIELNFEDTEKELEPIFKDDLKLDFLKD